ncbi:hypothetical protein RQP46_009899 [Phenoliferia psychrophenolica]
MFCSWRSKRMWLMVVMLLLIVIYGGTYLAGVHYVVPTGILAWKPFLILFFLFVLAIPASLGLAGWNIFYTHKYIEAIISTINSYRTLA